jgi:hypothetical protein
MTYQKRYCPYEKKKENNNSEYCIYTPSNLSTIALYAQTLRHRLHNSKTLPKHKKQALYK